MFYIDSHCHLTDKRYGSVEKVVQESLNDDVKLLVDVGWSVDSTFLAKNNADKFQNVYFSAGIHPSESLTFNSDDLKRIQSLLTEEKCIAVGEIGLDYHYDGTDKERQKELFQSQICLAEKFGLPIIIHSRDASKDMLDILSANKNHLQKGFLMHCYSESKEQAFNYLDLGAYFAFGGVITFKNAKKDDIVKSIPLDRIMVETDAPYMAPEPLRGTLNAPKNVVYCYKKLAKIYDVDIEFLKKEVAENFQCFFKKVSL